MRIGILYGIIGETVDVRLKENNMIENALTRKNVSQGMKITVKSLISAGIVALAVILPQIVHLAAGPQGGAQWLPMYLPVLLGGCLLGWAWGLGIGIMSPIVSFLITAAFGDPMPALTRLPFMAVELAVFAAVSGLFSKKIAKNGWTAFGAVLLAQVSGRAVFMLSALIFQAASPATVWAQIRSGLWGLILQAVLVPFIVMGLRLLLNGEKNDR